MKYEQLMKHHFTKSVLDAVRPEIAAEHEYKVQHGREAEYIPDEYGFYLMRVGNRLATLLSHCEQLIHSIFFITNYRETPTTRRAGITRAKHIRYGIESYIIRTQTVYDLVLKLVDAVFHLTNADSQCRHSTIVLNEKVRQSNIPSVLKPLRKKLESFRDARNTVIHRGGYREDDLYRLELYSVLEEEYYRADQDIPRELAFLPEAKREKIRDLVRKRKTQYTQFNYATFKLVAEVLDSLQEYFIKEESRLRRSNQEGTQKEKLSVCGKLRR